MIGVQNLSRRSGTDFGPILQQATAWWLAKKYSGSGNLLDQSGNGLDLTLPGGSNNPLFLAPESGLQYAHLPGTASNYFYCPDNATNSVTGDIDLRVRVNPDTWAANLCLMSKWSAGDIAFRWVVLSTKRVNLYLTTNGSTEVSAQSSANVPFADGTGGWLRVTWRQSDGRVQYFTCADQVLPPAAADYTQLGTDQTISIASIWDSSVSNLQVGMYATSGFPFAGKVYYAQMFNGINGTLVAKLDTSQIISPFITWADGIANTWTVSRSATGRKSTLVDQALFLFGTDDYLEAADNALLNFAASESLTVAVAMRQYATPSAVQTILAKKPGTTSADIGYRMSIDTSRHVVGAVADGTNGPSVTPGSSTSDGVAKVLTFIRDVSAAQLRAAIGGASSSTAVDTTTGTITNTNTLRIGRLSGAGTAYCDFIFLGAAVFRKQLKQVQLSQLAQDFGVAA